jgi:hypothetical protein
MNHKITLAVGKHQPCSAAYLAQVLQMSKREINQYLYHHPEQFNHSDNLPPMWSLVSEEQKKTPEIMVFVDLGNQHDVVPYLMRMNNSIPWIAVADAGYDVKNPHDNIIQGIRQLRDAADVRLIYEMILATQQNKALREIHICSRDKIFENVSSLPCFKNITVKIHDGWDSLKLDIA